MPSAESLRPTDNTGGRGNGGPPVDIAIDYADRTRFLEALAGTYPDLTRACLILDAIEFPPQRRPPFNSTSEVFWSEVFRELLQGIIPAPFQRLLEQVLRVYGSNTTYMDLADRYLRPAQVVEEPSTRPAPPQPTCHVIFRAASPQERDEAAAFLHRSGLGPVEIWSTPAAVSFQVNATEPADLRGLLDETMFGWTVVAPGNPDYLLHQLYVEGPDGRQFRITDAPAQQTVGNIAAEVVGTYPSFQNTKRPAVVDYVQAGGYGRRMNPDRTLDEEGVRDGDRLRVGFQATAASANPDDREDALFRVKNQILGYASEYPDVRVSANSDLAPTEYRLEFKQPSFAPPEAPGGEPSTSELHVVALQLGADFPVSAPQAFWMTPFFHPNVWPNYESPQLRENERAGGLVCLGALDESYQSALDLGELCAMLRDIAAYRNYSVYKADGTVDAAGRPGRRVDFFDPAAGHWVLSPEGQRRIIEIGGTPAYPSPLSRGNYTNLIERIRPGARP
jgi:hypothetical protein